MSVRNQNWYDLQSSRQYPLDDAATGADDAGALLPNNIVLDCNIKYPEQYGAFAFIQAITVSNGLVTILIGAGSNLDSASTATVAAVTVSKPIQLSKNYAIQPLVPGAAGWFVFGEGVEFNFTGRYATPRQTLIAPRNAHAYRALPLRSIKKKNVQNSLSGLVSIEAVAPLTAELKVVDINGKPQNALVFGLSAVTTDVDYNPLAYFRGTCSERPESGTCPKPPIETINGVSPDCSGNIELAVVANSGLTLYNFTSCGGLGLDLDIDLAEICGPRQYDPPREPADNCPPSSNNAGGA